MKKRVGDCLKLSPPNWRDEAQWENLFMNPSAFLAPAYQGA